MATYEQLIETVPTRYWLALAVLVIGFVLAYLTGIVNRRLLHRAGVPEAIEGTAFERTAQRLGTSTVDILAKLGVYFLIAVTIIVALTVARIEYVDPFWNQVAAFLPPFFFAVLIVIVGVVVGDKMELLVAERLRGVKIPQVEIIPLLVKYSVFFLAALIALGQIGVATLALIVLLAAYAFGVIVFAGLALRDLLASGAAGVFLLLNQPYGIGDEIRIGDRQGVVQEVDVFVTHVESDSEEYVIPNHLVFEDGLVRIRK